MSMKEGQGRNGKKDKGKLRAADRSHTTCWHLHRSKLVHRAARTRIAHGRSTRCCIVEVTLRKILDQNAHCIREYVRPGDVLVQDVMPTTAQRFDVSVSVSEFEGLASQGE